MLRTQCRVRVRVGEMGQSWGWAGTCVGPWRWLLSLDLVMIANLGAGAGMRCIWIHVCVQRGGMQRGPDVLWVSGSDPKDSIWADVRI